MAVLRIQDAPEAIEQAAKAAPSIDVPSPENLPSPQQAIETAQQVLATTAYAAII